MSERALLVTRAQVRGAVVDVRIDGGRITAIGDDLATDGAATLDAGGGALVPGLHDHHLHLLAMAAARRSLDAAVLPDGAALDAAVSRRHVDREGDRWLRIVGIDDRHGPVDRARLDALAPGRRVRAQHRSGAAWVLSSPALAAVGEEVDDGWIHRRDAELGRRWADDAPDLAPIGAELARLGVTGATDATPFDDPSALTLLAAAHGAGALPQRIVATGSPALATIRAPHGVERGPVKVLVADEDLPSVEQLAGWFRIAHDAGRPVAVHCVTRLGLVLALAAWEDAGAADGDRIEHGSVLPIELLATVAELGLTVVTQPALLRARGDAYLVDVDPDDVDHLYRCGSLIDAGIPVGLSTDAPFGPADPWLAIAAATDRRSSSGQVVGAARPSPRPTPSTGCSPRRRLLAVRPGASRSAPADLVLLDRPLAEALADPSAERVRRTWIGGSLVHDGDPG
ncbi:MAG: amidohydrolase family protein [Acidimicrobiales bacterium]